MASFTSLLLVLAGCRGTSDPMDGPAPEPQPESPPVETGAPDTATDTGTVPAGPPVPPYGGVRVWSDQRRDETGRWVDVFDVDGDGIDEAIICEPLYQLASHQGEDGVHLLRAPYESGPLAETAWATWIGTGFYWANPAIGLPGAVVVRGLPHDPYSQTEYPVHVLPVPSEPPTGQILSEAKLGTIQDTLDLGVVGLGRCQSASGPDALCLAAIQAQYDTFDFEGSILLFPLPLPALQPITDAETWLYGDEGERAQMMESEHDLDGDGQDDLVVGAYQSLGVGRVAVVAPVPVGRVRVWDAALGTITGDIPGGQLGGSVSAGDLDGDGHTDVLAAAPISEYGIAYALRGPFAGDRPVGAAEWSVQGDDPLDWTGYDQAIADVDGDGANDWVVGAPGNFYVAGDPGAVYVFLDPDPARLAPADADIVLTSGVTAEDWFGGNLAVGNLDGDGRADVVVGAPRDPTIGTRAGSATLFFGAAF